MYPEAVELDAVLPSALAGIVRYEEGPLAGTPQGLHGVHCPFRIVIVVNDSSGTNLIETRCDTHKIIYLVLRINKYIY